MPNTSAQWLWGIESIELKLYSLPVFVIVTLTHVTEITKRKQMINAISENIFNLFNTVRLNSEL